MPSNNDQEERASRFRELTDTIEARKEKKKRERFEKQKAEELKKKRKLQEKLVAPLLLIATVIISLALMIFSQ